MGYIYNNLNLKLKRKILRGNMPKPEQKLWYYLKGENIKGYKFRRQYSVGNYILDFYCPRLRLGIELDGDSHFINSEIKIYDEIREKFLKSQNIKIIRFTNTDIAENINSVVEKITKYLP